MSVANIFKLLDHKMSVKFFYIKTIKEYLYEKKNQQKKINKERTDEQIFD